jgi:LysR family hydrogen peroxide-inducible transcriptional activator
LTAPGGELVARARRVLLEADDLLELAKRSGDPLAGTLRVGVIPTISPYLLPSITPALRKQYAKLKVLWVEDKTDVLIRRLDEGTLDAALVAVEANIGEVEREVVARDPFMLVTSSSHALGATKKPVKPAELRHAGVLLLDEGHCFRDQALEICAKAKADELEFRATSLSTLAQMVASGAGVTLLPALAVATEARRASLRVRPFVRPEPGRTIALVWRKRSPLAVALRQMATTIKNAYPRA